MAKISSPEQSPEPVKSYGGSKEISLSIEETNKIRAKLGLKPLTVINYKNLLIKMKLSIKF